MRSAIPTLMPFGEDLRGPFLPQEPLGCAQLCRLIVHRTQPAQMERPRYGILCVGIDVDLLTTRQALLATLVDGGEEG
jgi:hypothetical protein